MLINLHRLQERVMKDEGFRAKSYLDTEGIPTIGYGTTRWPGMGEVQLGESILPEDAKTLLRGDLWGAILDAEHIFTRFHEMNAVRQEVLANMAYNLGRSRLAGFKKMIAAAFELDYKKMAEEMVDSKWYKQVGGRAQRLVAAMRTGEWIA
jgi:lysozyme